MATKKFSYKPRNIFRAGLALWRVLRDSEDTNANVEEAAIVEFAFNRSRWGQKIARWDLLASEATQSSPDVARLMNARTRLPEVDLNALAALPTGTLGHTFATVARRRGIDPNLVEKMPATTASFSSILMLRTVWNDRDAVASHTRAFVDGYHMGSNARCLFGLDWASAYDRDLDELRAEWRVAPAGKFPELSVAA